jgi:hypothetical protein
VMRAHLQETPIEAAFLANEHSIHGGLHGVIDAALDTAAEQLERSLMGVEDHLLRLARIGRDQRHPAVAQPEMRNLHRRRHAAEHDNLVRPVELVRLTRCKPQRNEDRRRQRGPTFHPSPRVATHTVIAAGVAFGPQRLEHPHPSQMLAPSLHRVRRQHPLKPSAERSKPRQRLRRAPIPKLRLATSQRLPNRLPRHPQIQSDPPYPFLANEMLSPDPPNRLHDYHPRPCQPLLQSEVALLHHPGWSTLRRRSAPSRSTIPRRFPLKHIEAAIDRLRVGGLIYALENPHVPWRHPGVI